MYEPGQILIAPPAQKDEFWNSTVIYIYEKTPHGTAGLVVNKPSDKHVRDLADHHKVVYGGNDALYIGGPVKNSAIVLLHTNDWHCSNTFQITDRASISSDKSMISRIADGDTPHRWKMFLGMSVWAPGQLEAEIEGTEPWTKRNSWLIAPANNSILFDNEPERAWKRSITLAVKEATGSLFDAF
jgi:putative transcriptional regulator